MPKGRPEHQAPPEIFYNEIEARKYTSNSHIMQVQEELTERALELLDLPEDTPCYLLDLGCGSGLSGQCLTENGHDWVGIDISSDMLDVAREREVEGDLVLGDMGAGLPFGPGSFDGAISISAVQWLCNADKSGHNPVKRLCTFFSSLYTCLKRGSKAVLQFYPENNYQEELIKNQAMRAGFTGGVVTDYPNSSKAKKKYMVLFTGGSSQPLPQALGTENAASARMESMNSARETFKNRNQKNGYSDWILKQKEKRRQQGREVPKDTKYTARKRRTLASRR